MQGCAGLSQNPNDPSAQNMRILPAAGWPEPYAKKIVACVVLEGFVGCRRKVSS